MRAIGTFALVLAMASPALAGPANSTIGGKKLEEDMVHSAGTGFPSTFYEWWNSGKKNLDWALTGELVYDDWGASGIGGRVQAFGFRIRTNLIRIGLGVNGVVRWNLASKKRPKVTNDTAILFKPGVLIAGNTFNTFTFGIRGELGVPVSIDVHERVSVVTGGFIPFNYFVNKDTFDVAWIPLLIRMGVEIDAGDRVAPFFFFDLGPGISVFSDGGGSDGSFAWRIGAGTAFWGVLGKSKSKSDSSATASSEPAGEVFE